MIAETHEPAAQSLGASMTSVACCTNGLCVSGNVGVSYAVRAAVSLAIIKRASQPGRPTKMDDGLQRSLGSLGLPGSAELRKFEKQLQEAIAQPLFLAMRSVRWGWGMGSLLSPTPVARDRYPPIEIVTVLWDFWGFESRFPPGPAPACAKPPSGARPGLGLRGSAVRRCQGCCCPPSLVPAAGEPAGVSPRSTGSVEALAVGQSFTQQLGAVTCSDPIPHPRPSSAR